uniref:Retinoic acid induced 1 n=1 Tax=Latimeria chalumnae TaxID=7897 RepID=H3AX41_LATCH
MQSFRERCGFHDNQQSYQQAAQDSSRLENYRHQSQPRPNCERHGLVTEEYYNQHSYQGYESSNIEKYHRANKQLSAHQLQARPSFSNYTIHDNSTYLDHFSGEESIQNWGSQHQPLVGRLTKYEQNSMKKNIVPPSGGQYQEQSVQLALRNQSLQTNQQAVSAYPKLQQQKIQNDVTLPMTYSQASHFPQHSQSFPTSSSYSLLPDRNQTVRAYTSCTTPSNQQLGTTNVTSGHIGQSSYCYQPTPGATGYAQPHSLHGRQLSQESSQYQNLTKYHHYKQPAQTFCPPDTTVRTPEQYYQTFSPSSNQSPARSVGRSPSYSSTPSPLMPNLENFQFNQQSINTEAFPSAITEQMHLMPLLNPSPTDTSSPEPPTGSCKGLQMDRIPDKVLSDPSLQSLTALTSQVENISNTVHQLLLSKALIPHKKNTKQLSKSSEVLKFQNSCPENSGYSVDHIGTPLSEPLGTPQSVHTESQEADSDDQPERNYFLTTHSRSPARALTNSKGNPESVSSCSVTSPDNMSTKSDDSLQSIHGGISEECFSKLFGNERKCPKELSSNTIAQEERSPQGIFLEDVVKENFERAVWSDKSDSNKETMKIPLILESDHKFSEQPVQTACLNQENLSFQHKCDKASIGINYLKGSISNDEVDKEIMDSKNPFGPLACSYRNSIKTTDSNNKEDCYSSKVSVDSTSSNHTKHYSWTDKSINETHLRWKGRGPNIPQFDSQRHLLASKLGNTYKEEERICLLVSSDGPASHKNEQTRAFNTKGDQFHSGTAVTTSQGWMTECRHPCTSADLEEVPKPKSPEEAAITSTERKSVICDISPSKHSENTVVLLNFDDDPQEESITNKTEENNKTTSRLSGQSVIHLGPAVAAESKVKSWFQSSLSHVKFIEEMVASEDSLNDEVSCEPTISAKVTNMTFLEKNPDEMAICKTLRNRKISYRSVEDVCRDSLAQDNKPVRSSKDKSRSLIGQIGKTNKIVSNQEINSNFGYPLGRMCTRSCTLVSAPKIHNKSERQTFPHQKHLVKEIPCKSKKKAASKICKRLLQQPVLTAFQDSTDKKSILFPSASMNVVPNDQKFRSLDPTPVQAEKQGSMVLRSRTKPEAGLHIEKLKDGNSLDLSSKKCKASKKCTSRNLQKKQTFLNPQANILQCHKKEKVGTKIKAQIPSVEIRKTNSEKITTLKRKANSSSPIPAKRRNRFLKRKNTKVIKTDETSYKNTSLTKTAIEKLPKVTSDEITLNHTLTKELPNVCINIAPCTPFPSLTKTKVLPPRKGRGLKLEAIVQKITFPNSKKLASSCNVDNSPENISANGKKQLFKTTDGSLSIEDAKLQDNNVSEATTTNPENEYQKSCVSKTRLQQAKILRRKERSFDETNLSKRPMQHKNSISRSSIKLSSKKRNRKNVTLKTFQDNPEKQSSLLSSPAQISAYESFSSKSSAIAKHAENKNRTRTRKGGCSASEPTKSRHQNKKKKNANHSSFNGYSTRQKKHLIGKKSKSIASKYKSRITKQRSSIMRPEEPEIKLKYGSFKPLRAKKEAKLFSPYIHFEKENNITSICTVINTQEEEAKFHKEVKMSLIPRPSVTHSKVIPSSSIMLLGPLVLKTLNDGCLVCCLCGRPANYKELGDLCGPYYPASFLLAKKSAIKERKLLDASKAERLKPLPSESVATETNDKSLLSIEENQPRLDSTSDITKTSGVRSSSRGLCRKQQSCYCCDSKSEDTEPEKSKSSQCNQVDSQLGKPVADSKEHWFHESCVIWTQGVYLVAGKLYGLKEAIETAITVVSLNC